MVSLLALSVLLAQGGPVKSSGKAVAERPAERVQDKEALTVTQLAGWSGLKYKAQTDGGFSTYWSGYDAPKAFAEAPVCELRMKVYAFTSVYQESPRLQRNKDLSSEAAGIETALQAVPALALAATRGAVKLKLDYERIDATVFVAAGDEPGQALSRLVLGRENAQGFASDDGVFRGPYIANAILTPDMTPTQMQMECVRRLEAGLRYQYTLLGADPTEGEDKTLFAGLAAEKDYTDPVLSKYQGKSIAFPISQVAPHWAPNSSNTSLEFVKDPKRGEVLRYSERGGMRRGGFSLPAPAVRAEDKRLSFWVRSDSKEPLFLVFGGKDSRSVYALGEDRSYGLSKATPLEFRPDGAWQRIVAPIPAGTNSLAFEATVGGFEKYELKGAVYEFSDFEVLPDDPAVSLTQTLEFKPNFLSPNLIERRLALHGLKEGDDLRPALKLLDDPDDDVRIEAIRVLADKPEARSQIEANIYHIDPFISGAAVVATAKRNDPQALFILKRALGNGPGYRRIMAARAVADLKVGEAIGSLSALAADPNAMVRAEGAIALGKLGSEEAGKLLTVFLSDRDTYVRLKAVESANPDQEFVGKRLLYTLVNDPSDWVRARAALKLAGAKDANLRRDAWKAVRDDSSLTRARFVLEMDPAAPEFAAAADTALADEHPLVRAALSLRLQSAKTDIQSSKWAKLLTDSAPIVKETFHSTYPELLRDLKP